MDCCVVMSTSPRGLFCFVLFLTNLLPFRILQRLLQDWRGDRVQRKWVLAELSWWWSTTFSAVAHFSPQPLPALILLSWQLTSDFSELISLSSTWITSLWLLLARVLCTGGSRATSESQCPLWQHFLVNLAYFNHFAMLALVKENIASLLLLLRGNSVEVQSK